MNHFEDKKQVHYFIDYAHTPNALKSVLTFLNKVK
jgi:UDP-N-acetylmuramyl tripeptide synthase